MPKSTRRRNRKYKKHMKTKKYRRQNKKYKKGGDDYYKVNCCMCGNEVDIKDTLIPRECLNKYGQKAHRICSECWWRPETGFASETASHKCPGCVKNLPLTKVPIKKPEFIDLTLDDD